MAGRGGRGLALLEALKQKLAQQPGREEDSTPPPTAASAAPVVPGGRGGGRGALMQALSRVAGSAPVAAPTPAAPVATATPAAPVAAAAAPSGAPPSAGRGSLLLALARGRAMTISMEAAGPSSGNTSPPAQDSASPPPLKLEGGPPTRGMRNLNINDNPPVVKRGECGKRIKATANFIRLKCEPNKGFFEYEVRFQPEVDSKNMRFKLLNSVTGKLGGVKNFDGVLLYLPIRLEQEVTILDTKHPVDDSPVTIKVIYKKTRRMGECIHFYNVIFNKIFKILSFARMGRQHFNPNAGQTIPQHKLEIWPGYVTAVDEYEGGLMLNINASHRVLRMLTCYDVIKEITSKSRDNFKSDVTKELVGACVLTRYNNKLYRVDDISFEMTARSSFDDRHGGQTSFMDYYKKQYDITVKDPNQPLLISRVKQRTAPKDGEESNSTMICLIPELCYMTGLTDGMRADFKIMKDLATHTRISPNQRQLALRKFMKSVVENEQASKALSDWGLSFDSDTVSLEARVVPEEKIAFGNKEVIVSAQADWSRDATNSRVLSAIDVREWVILHTNRDGNLAKDFVECYQRVGRQMGIEVAQPHHVPLQNDRTESYIRALRENIRPQVQLVVIIFPSSRDDRYSAVKKVCCVEQPVASQVINSRTISKPDKLRSVVQKIALQINCKAGGTLWAVKIPFDDIMVCGVDTYHEASRKSHSVAGFVASLNQPLTRWFSKVAFQTAGQELVDGLKSCLISALKKYYDVNGKFPERIVMFRDGVGDGQLNTCAEWEIPQLKSCFTTIRPDYAPKMTVVIVQKRINARIFHDLNGSYENPPPGTVMDNTITRRNWYDFFLVSQFSRQGTVTPTHYVVVYDGCEMKVDYVQRLSYKMTHMYYNWPGTIRVPAPCQYAHKLAYLVGQNVHKEPSDKLADRLYFL